MRKNAKPRRAVNIKSIALPSEHGGWGFLIEPILLGLLVAFTWQGVLLAVSAFGVFLIHQPLKIATKDRLKRRRPPRAVWAERFAIGYALLVIIPLVILFAIAPLTFLLPIALAVPFAATQLYYDTRNRSRYFIPEACGAVALAVVASAIALLNRWDLWLAMALWLILAFRAVTAILYVRARIRLKFKKPARIQVVWIAHSVALLGVVGLVVIRLVPIVTIVPFVILLGRSAMGLSKYRKSHPVKVIGFQELAYGLMTVIVIAFGYMLNF